MAPKMRIRRPAGVGAWLPPPPMAMAVMAKAKAKGKAKAKAGAANARVRRRSGGVPGGVTPWKKGEEVDMNMIAVEELEVGQEISIEKAYHLL